MSARATAKSVSPEENALTASSAFPLSTTLRRIGAPADVSRVAIIDINWTASPSKDPAATVSVVGWVA